VNWLQLFQRYLPDFIKGAGVTIELTVVGLVIGFFLGLVLALARSYGPGWLKAIAVGYIELFRGTPLLVQLFIIY
jgi:His/Glu/Gln/Arg/opine family amino acid ABC transporter permease subunit